MTCPSKNFLGQHLKYMTVEKSTRRIMVVEDYDDTRLLLKQGLEMLGYSVLEASNGQEAVDIAERERPDLILMDLDLPILDGIAATQHIRQQQHMESVPIVAVTAYPLSYSRVKAFAKGCNEYMPKPIDMSDLARVVARYLSP
jgi:two-component system, cell cycle response regulator DivK